MCMEKEPRNPNKVENGKITVLGLGESGKNILNCLFEKNTDFNLLCTDWEENCISESKIRTVKLFNGRDDYLNCLYDEIKDSSKLIITTGLGGRFGSFISSSIALLAKSLGIETKLVLSIPADFEGRNRRSIANEALLALQKFVYDCTVLPFDALISKIDTKTTLNDCFKIMDETVCRYILGENII